VNQNTFVDSLYVNPGPGDTDPWPMNDGSVSTGMCGMLTVQGDTAAYKIFRRAGGENGGE
jgi:hypothetical protein